MAMSWYICGPETHTIILRNYDDDVDDGGSGTCIVSWYATNTTLSFCLSFV